jgi:hypothetical protein
MSQGVNVTLQQQFEAGVNKALEYGKVFVQGEAVKSGDDAASKVSNSKGDSSNSWSSAMFPNLKMLLSKQEAIFAQEITGVLASLSDTLEGRSLRVFASVCSHCAFADTVQKQLDPFLKELCAIDTHSEQLRMDCKYPVGNPVAFQPSAKPDLTAALLALFWEVWLFVFLGWVDVCLILLPLFS